MRLQHLLTLILIIIVIGCGAKKEQSKNKVQQGPADYVEQASFTSLKGDSVHVSDFKGKIVLIDFWETWCKPCIGSFSGIDKLTDKYPDDFVVLAVTPGFTDTAEDAKEFAANNDYDFTYLMDSNGLHKKLNVGVIPYKLFIDANGEFISSSQGSSGPEGDYKKIKKMIEKHKKSK